jgi:hypothetical protein
MDRPDLNQYTPQGEADALLARVSETERTRDNALACVRELQAREDRYRYAIEQALHLLELGRDFDVSHAKVWLRNALAGCVELPENHIAEPRKMVEPHGVPQCGATTRKGTICGQPARYEVGEPGDDPMPVCSEHQTRAATMGWPNRRIAAAGQEAKP